MSHSKQEYSKKIADAILVLLDEAILEEIVGSKSINSIDDWYSEITNELFPNTERYAKNLISDIPNNKYYELSVMLYKNRNNISKLKDKIIDELVNNLSHDEFKAYCDVIERDLFGNVQEKEIISLLNSDYDVEIYDANECTIDLYEKDMTLDLFISKMKQWKSNLIGITINCQDKNYDTIVNIFECVSIILENKKA